MPLDENNAGWFRFSVARKVNGGTSGDGAGSKAGTFTNCVSATVPARRRRQTLEPVGQELRREQKALRGAAVGDVDVLAGPAQDGTQGVLDHDPAVVDAAVDAGARGFAADHALARCTQLQLVMRAADPDRGLRGQQLVLVAADLADLPGEGAQSALDEPEDHGIGAILAAVEDVALDAKLGVGLERDERIVGKTQLRMALSPGNDRVAHAQRRARGERDTGRAANRRNVADREHHLADGLRQRLRARGQAPDQQRGLHDGADAGSHRGTPT